MNLSGDTWSATPALPEVQHVVGTQRSTHEEDHEGQNEMEWRSMGCQCESMLLVRMGGCWKWEGHQRHKGDAGVHDSWLSRWALWLTSLHQTTDFVMFIKYFFGVWVSCGQVLLSFYGVFILIWTTKGLQPGLGSPAACQTDCHEGWDDAAVARPCWQATDETRCRHHHELRRTRRIGPSAGEAWDLGSKNVESSVIVSLPGKFACCRVWRGVCQSGPWLQGSGELQCSKKQGKTHFDQVIP